MSKPLLQLSDVTKSFGGIKALSGLSCEVRQGQIVGVIGPNGAGKTTLFNVITGAYRANFDVSSNTKLHKWLVWNLSFSDRYLSDPVAGRKPNDILYTTGVGLTFGH